MNKYSDYTLVTAETLKELVDKVDALMKREGWQPVGGIQYIEFETGKKLVQSLAR